MILAFVGRSYSGKSLASSLVCKIDPRFVKRSFAGVLRNEFSLLKEVPIERLISVHYKEEYRHQLIQYAEEKKQIDRAYFAKRLFEQIPENEFTVIDDLRFIEELQLCLSRRAVIFKVHADSRLRKQRGWYPNPVIDNDYSETEMDLSGDTLRTITSGAGGILFNTKDEEYLKIQIEEVLNRFFPRIPIRLGSVEF